MSQISYIKYADIKEARRYDAEYFKPEYLIDDCSIEKKGFNFLHSIAEIKGGKRLPLGESFSNEGIPYIRAEDIKNGFVNSENAPKISESLHKKLISYQTKRGDVLLTIVGSVGDVGIVAFDLKKCNLTENATRIFNTNEVNAETIFIFLLSRFGQNQICREKVGTVQSKLAIARIRNFKIPRFSQSFQDQIAEKTQQSYRKQTESKQLYRKAEELLLFELGLLNYKVKNVLAFETTKKEIDEAGRYDSEYFQPKYEEIIKKIEKYEGGFDVVEKIVGWQKGYEVGAETYCENGKGFARVSDFSIFGIEEPSKRIPEEIFDGLKDKFQPKKDEILFTKDGTIGVSCVLKDNFEGILSGAFLRLSPKEEYKTFEKECLSLIFNSLVCKMQIEKLSGGAIIAHLKPSDFELIKVPIIRADIQKQIAAKIQESHKLRKESKKLLEEAKRKVEEEIEKEYKKSSVS